MTDKLRGGKKIGKRMKHIEVSFQSIPALEVVLSACTETSCSRLGRTLMLPRAEL